MYKELCIKGS